MIWLAQLGHSAPQQIMNSVHIYSRTHGWFLTVFKSQQLLLVCAACWVGVQPTPYDC